MERSYERFDFPVQRHETAKPVDSSKTGLLHKFRLLLGFYINLKRT